MKKPESIKELYEYKFGSIPESLSKEIGHFNLFRVEPFKEGKFVPSHIAVEIIIKSCSSKGNQIFFMLTGWFM